MICCFNGIIFYYKTQNAQKVTPTSLEHFGKFETRVGSFRSE